MFFPGLLFRNKNEPRNPRPLDERHQTAFCRFPDMVRRKPCAFYAAPQSPFAGQEPAASQGVLEVAQEGAASGLAPIWMAPILESSFSVLLELQEGQGNGSWLWIDTSSSNLCWHSRQRYS
jgi:hypothetical protein